LITGIVASMVLLKAGLERMVRIHRMIEDGKFPNFTKMSGAFEMSERTVKRDIEFMRIAAVVQALSIHS